MVRRSTGCTRSGASSANGLAYMAENAVVAAFYRLPIVMAAVNRTLGPPWNIWADQGDTLMFRDFAWIQLYCDSNQDVADTALLAFRLAEDPRVLLPVMVCMDGFIISHTSMEVELAEQGRLGAGRAVDAVLLDTPFGFQENAPILASKATEYFRDAVGRDVDVAGHPVRDSAG